MARARHSPGIPCGLPSPGSRQQGYQGGEHLRPARTEDALIAAPDEPVTCRRCRRIVARQGGGR